MRKKVIIVVGILFLILLIKSAGSIIKVSPVLFQLFFHKNIDLKKTSNNINVLLLGVGGGAHDGPDLTDTIMFASIDEKKNNVHLLSLPRDMWIPDLKARINTAYSSGEAKRKGGGMVLAKAAVSKVTGQKIDYVVIINFDGFVRAVDLVGGLDIDVERSFDDYEYPVEDKKEDLCGNTLGEATEKIATLPARLVFPCRYQHVHFDKGLQQMDGEKALIFVRSRYAVGVEGTDFSRSKRQQKVIQSFKDKLLSLGILLNPIKLTNLYNVVAESIITNVETSEFDDFIKLADQMKHAKINSHILEVQDLESNKTGLLINPPLADFNGSWVLIPRKGNGEFSEIHTYVTCVLTSDSCIVK